MTEPLRRRAGGLRRPGEALFRAAAVPALLSAAAILALRWTGHGGPVRPRRAPRAGR